MARGTVVKGALRSKWPAFLQVVGGVLYSRYRPMTLGPVLAVKVRFLLRRKCQEKAVQLSKGRCGCYCWRVLEIKKRRVRIAGRKTGPGEYDDSIPVLFLFFASSVV